MNTFANNSPPNLNPNHNPIPPRVSKPILFSLKLTRAFRPRSKFQDDDEFEGEVVPERPPSLVRSQSLIQREHLRDQLAPYVFDYGTKLGNLLFYLKSLLEKDTTARFI